MNITVGTEKPSDLVVQEDLKELLECNNYCLVLALCSVSCSSEQDAIALSLLHYFESRHLMMSLIKQAIRAEVATTFESGTLFRGLSVFIKIVSVYLKKTGGDYLTKTLKDCIKQVVKVNSSLEVDPSRITSSEQAIKNMDKIAKFCNKFLNALYTSLAYLPAQLRRVFLLVHNAVKAKFPGEELKAVGAFFFLRFVCPSVVAPDGFGIIDTKLEPQHRRALILISKVLQTMANNIPFGEKEHYMEPLNPYINQNLPKLYEFLGQLCLMPAELEVTSRKDIGVVADDVQESARLSLLYYLYRFRDTVFTELTKEDTFPGCSLPMSHKVADDFKVFCSHFESPPVHHKLRKELYVSVGHSKNRSRSLNPQETATMTSQPAQSKTPKADHRRKISLTFLPRRKSRSMDIDASVFTFAHTLESFDLGDVDEMPVADSGVGEFTF
eukprot:GCRY01004596.1.p1 GENE.GCRY01004596.1~~GCRY01004596.1.p1  ORF type:complete len:441 (-),score=63.79 GCRY01004596.1:169-1491(-)